MATYRDLEPLPYFRDTASKSLVAVGWLGRDQPFSKGTIPEAVYQQLKRLLVHPFQPVVAPGFHECDLCQFEAEHRGSLNLFVPTEKRIFVCPELIAHYINAHEYRPPCEFCEAVLACPHTGSIEYKRLFLASGGRELLQNAGADSSLKCNR